MDAELFVHGVPHGASFWGKEEDHSYFKLFYDNSSDAVKFFIQIRHLNGKRYCYYNYLVYKTPEASSPNIVDSNGRSGSYFGLSLRIDAYCKDFGNMYRILDTTYNLYIVGSVLKSSGARLQYTVSDFAGVSHILQSVKDFVIQLIKKGFSSANFVSLDNFKSSGSSGNYPQANLYDCTQDNVLGAIKEQGCVALSPYWPRSKEKTIQKDCDAKIKSFQQQSETRLKAKDDEMIKERQKMDTDISLAKKKISQLESDVNQKREEIEQYKRKVDSLQTEIKKSGQSKQISQLVGQIKEPITELTKILKEIVPTQTVVEPDRIQKKPPQPVWWKKYKTKILTFILFAASLVTVIYVVKACRSDENVIGNEEYTTNSITTTEDVATKSSHSLCGNNKQVLQDKSNIQEKQEDLKETEDQDIEKG